MLGDLVLQESSGDAGFFGHSGGRQLVEVAVFVLAAAEVAGLDPALVDQRLEAVVGLAQADADLLGQRALADFRVGFQGPEQAKAGFQVQERGFRVQGSGFRRGA